MQNVEIGVVWGIRDHLRSPAMLPFDTVHMTSYLTLTETMHLSCTIFTRDSVAIARICHGNSVCLSVCHTGGSVKNG